MEACPHCDELRTQLTRLRAELDAARLRVEQLQSMREALALACLEGQAVGDAFERMLRQIQRTVAHGMHDPLF